MSLDEHVIIQVVYTTNAHPMLSRAKTCHFKPKLFSLSLTILQSRKTRLFPNGLKLWNLSIMPYWITKLGHSPSCLLTGKLQDASECLKSRKVLMGV